MQTYVIMYAMQIAYMLMAGMSPTIAHSLYTKMHNTHYRSLLIANELWVHI